MNLGHILTHPLDDVGDLAGKIVDNTKDGIGDIGHAFSGKNSDDSIAHLGSKLSLDPVTRALVGKNLAGAWDDMQTRVPDRVNQNFASILHGDGAPGVSHAFDSDKDYDAASHAGAYAGKGGGIGQWVMNKPATTVAALITAGEFLGGAMGGAGAGSEGSVTAATPAEGGASTGAGSAPSSATNWQQYMRMGSQGSGGQQDEEEAQPPMAEARPNAPAVSVNLGARAAPPVTTDLSKTLVNPHDVTWDE